MITLTAVMLVVTVLFAWGQGKLMPAIKRTPYDSPEAKMQGFVLHWVFVAIWAAPLVLSPLFLNWQQVGYAVGIALALRYCFFDPALNLGEGTTVFAVGGSAGTDLLLRKFAGLIGIPVTYLSALSRGLVFLALCMFINIEFL